MIWAVLAAPLVVFPLAAAPFIGIPQLGLFLGAVAVAFILIPLFGMYAGPGGLVGLPICGGIVGATAWWIVYRLPQRRGSDL